MMYKISLNERTNNCDLRNNVEMTSVNNEGMKSAKSSACHTNNGR